MLLSVITKDFILLLAGGALVWGAESRNVCGIKLGVKRSGTPGLREESEARISMRKTLLIAFALLLPQSGEVFAQISQPAKVMIGDVELHYIERGEGEPVILLHGGQGDYRAWPLLMDALAPRYRAISYSRRYHWPNANTLNSSHHSAIIDAEDLASLIRALNLGSVHLVGTSYGAFTALALAIKHPELVRTMVLAEPPVQQWLKSTARGAALYREREETVYEPAKRAFAAGNDEAAMRLFIDTFDGQGTFEQLPAERRASIMQNARFFKVLTLSSDPFPNLSKNAVRRLTMPILIVRGEHTDELHWIIVQELGRLVPRAHRLTIPQAGHGSPRQNPKAFNSAVLEFLEKQGNIQRINSGKY